ncbi:MAG: GDP-L-fucose synthase [Verrucomicrobiae bacterium]|nr:GDP-L-fucose synthase [Verrucomicrobiae bacterium]
MSTCVAESLRQLQTNPDFWRGRRVLVTGASGFIGANLVPLLRQTGCELYTPTHAEFDLLEQADVRAMLGKYRPELVFHLAGLVGGIGANKARPAEFCYQNLLMGTMMLHESWRAGVRKYVTLIGGCSYPSNAPNPINETELFNGMPQPESAPYSLAKAMSVVQAEAYRRQYGFNAIVLVPGNIYGPHDNFNLENSHVIPALIRKFVEAQRTGAREVVVWGTGRPVRDFVYVRDVCEAIILAAERYDKPDIVNISSGRPVTIRELVETIAELVGYQGQLVWDTSKPDGQMFKGFDVTRMRQWLGYECRTPLREGLRLTIEWFKSNPPGIRL